MLQGWNCQELMLGHQVLIFFGPSHLVATVVGDLKKSSTSKNISFFQYLTKSVQLFPQSKTSEKISFFRIQDFRKKIQFFFWQSKTLKKISVKLNGNIYKKKMENEIFLFPNFQHVQTCSASVSDVPAGNTPTAPSATKGREPNLTRLIYIDLQPKIFEKRSGLRSMREGKKATGKKIRPREK